MAFLGRIMKFLLKALLIVLVTIFAVRGFDAMRGPTLAPWHRFVPEEASARAIDAMDWKGWLAQEELLFASVREAMATRMVASEKMPANRYWAESPVNPARLATDWNRSFTLMPEGEPVGAAVLLHGLTDAPYSLRHIARNYQARGYAVVAIRMPGHGTVPAGLTKAEVADWQAATRLAVRTGRALAGAGKPLHFVGYSNGGALAITHTVAALDNPALGRPDRIILISPMIGLTPFARFSGLASWPAIVPAFANAAWLDLITEFNPFKYNSFPVKAAVESHRLTEHVARDLDAARADGRIARMPPILAFQSVVDSTIRADAVVNILFAALPANGSEVVLFDVNRAALVGPMLRASATGAAQRLLPEGPQRYRRTLVTNAAPGDAAAVARSTAPGETAAIDTPLGLAWPATLHSLGHVALPFPVSDGLYGIAPDPADDQGVTIGALPLRGENGTLAISPNMLLRISSNPFFPWMLERIAAAAPE